MSFSRNGVAAGGNNHRHHRGGFRPSSSSTQQNIYSNGGSAVVGIDNNYSRNLSGVHRQRPPVGADDNQAGTTGAGAAPPPLKRRRSAWEQGGGGIIARCSNTPSTSSSSFLNLPLPPVNLHSLSINLDAPSTRRCTKLEEEDVFMSRDEIERCSPSRKDGIDLVRETHLRYSYCAFLQNLGMRLELPQTTIGTAMVLCHRFFVRRSHACHDRFLVATSALFLAAKSEETPCPLNTVLRASCEICHKQNLAFFPNLLPVDWFEQYRERIIEAEQMILTTLDFELNVQHPYTPLTSVLNELGLSQTVLVNLAWNLINEGLRSSLWLQFKPHHIAAGAVFLAAKFLNFDLACYQSIWQEFHTTTYILQDVVQQLMELF